MPGPTAAPIVLTADEREVLEDWACRPGGARSLARRSRIVLACAEGGTNGQVAARVGVSARTVATWRRRFATARLAGLSDEPRAGRPRSLSGSKIREVVTRTLEEAPPAGATRWTSRSMARASGLSQSTVSRMWRALGIRPQPVEARTIGLSRPSQIRGPENNQ